MANFEVLFDTGKDLTAFYNIDHKDLCFIFREKQYREKSTQGKGI